MRRKNNLLPLIAFGFAATLVIVVGVMVQLNLPADQKYIDLPYAKR